MVITVTLLAIQNSPQPDAIPRLRAQRRIDVTLLSGSTLAEQIPDLGLELPLESTVLEVNGRPAGLSTVLHHGDRVDLTPAATGVPAGE